MKKIKKYNIKMLKTNEATIICNIFMYWFPMREMEKYYFAEKYKHNQKLISARIKNMVAAHTK